jgi:hypothetical protein
MDKLHKARNPKHAPNMTLSEPSGSDSQSWSCFQGYNFRNEANNIFVVLKHTLRIITLLR